MRPTRPAALLLAVVLAACTAEPAPSSSPTAGTGTAPPPTTSSPTASPSSAPASPSSAASPSTATSPSPTGLPLDEATAAWRPVGEGFEGPVQVLTAPDGRVLVVEQAGRISTLGGDTVLDLTDRVAFGGERGLLAATFAPDGGRLLVHYSGSDGRTVVAAFPVGDGGVDAATETVLFEQAQPAANHNGGSLVFAPDGTLVLALGDGGGAGDQFGNGQDTGTLLGGLLRFRIEGQQLVPAPDNPFVDGGGAAALWAYGLRNPWRIAFHDGNLYVADVGQDAVEEITVLPVAEVSGANFGWPRVEGTACFAADDCDPTGTVPPIAELRHTEGACSIIGGVVVPPGHPTGLGGAYLYSDLCDTQLRALRMTPSDPERATVAGAELPGSPLGFGTGAAGEVWVGTQSGQVLELVPG